MEKTDTWMVMLGIVILLVALGGAATGARPEAPAVTAQSSGTWTLITINQTESGQGNENSDHAYNVSVGFTNLVSMDLKLTWKDESPARTGLTNQPDELGLQASSPTGETRSNKASNTVGGEGSVALGFTFNVTQKSAASKTSKTGMGDWNITVHVGTCGDQTPRVPDPFGLRTVKDTGNAYTLSYSYSYYAKVKGGR